MYLHKSIEKIKNDRKLTLLSNGVITPAQFANLIENTDPYIMIGPAIVEKGSISQFLLEWKTRSLSVSEEIKEKITELTPDEVVASFERLRKVYPEIEPLIKAYDEALKSSTCESCTKSRYVSSIVSLIRKLGVRDEDREYTEILLERFGGVFSKKINSYDIEWIEAESIKGLGKDIIPGLSNCLECSIKHLGRAKILYNEALNGYPEHNDIAINELTSGNRDLEEWWISYMDCCSEMDMASYEATGDFTFVQHRRWSQDILELANEIRQQRLLFQDDPKNVPDFDRIENQVEKA